jgi:hypothetical protein
MKLGFICLDLPGHVNPMTALARQLQARKHDVVFLYSSGAAGLPFVRCPEKDHINENRLATSRKQGEDALQFSVRAVLAQTESILKSIYWHRWLFILVDSKKRRSWHDKRSNVTHSLIKRGKA